jgi:hypothetical protein
MNRNFKELNVLVSFLSPCYSIGNRENIMILITFKNQETYEFQDSFMAKCFIGFQSTQSISVVKVRCDRASDYVAIEEYLRLLNNNIQ